MMETEGNENRIPEESVKEPKERKTNPEETAGTKWTPEQNQVITLRNRNILVSAAAGSGKTATLVERIIRRVTSDTPPVDIDRLLIVTFTRAAAAEMRERIGNAIEEKRRRQPENIHLQKQALLLHSAQITTIDSFCLSVIRDYFHEIDLDPVFRVAEEEELTLLRHEVITDVLEEAYERGDADFLAFAASYGGRHQDLRLEDYILRLFAFSESCPWPEEWLKGLCDAPNVEEGNAASALREKENSGETGETSGGECYAWIVRFVRQRLSEAVKLNEKALALCDASDGPVHYGQALRDDAELLEGLLCCQEYRELSERFCAIKFTALSRKAMPECSEEKKNAVKALREQVKDCIKELSEDFFFQSAGEMEADEAGAGRYVRVLVELTLSFREKFAAKKSEKHVLDFSDIEHFALDILVEKRDGVPVARTAAKELRRRFEEIMIDEYQDSNEVQEAILSSISREEEGAPNIFMVGDMKQSIYRFRLAKPELFLEKYNTYSLGESKYQRVDLHKNFRSRAEVLYSVNELFFRIMGKGFGQIEYDKTAALYPGAKYLAHGAAEAPEIDNRTELLLVKEDVGEDAGKTEPSESLENDEENEEREYSEREKEALLCAERIKKLCKDFAVQEQVKAVDGGKPEYVLRPCRYGDIVILLRTMSGWAEIFAKVLSEQGIPAVSDTQSGYFNVPEIKWLLNYLRILDNPRQDIPYVNVLLSPFAGLTTGELARIRSREKHVPIAEAVRKCAAPYIIEERRIGIRLASFLRIYDELRERSRMLSVPELLEELFAKTGYDSFVSAMPAGGRRSRNLRMFVEKAAAFERSSYRGLFQFIRYVERLMKYEVDYGEAADAAEGEDAVRIMSIHRSKGLEFPVVFVCGMTKKFNFTDMRERLLFHPEAGLAMDYIDTEKRTVTPTLKKKMLKHRMTEEMLGEELRLLYVAMTRAKEKLYLTGYVKNYEKLEQSWAAVSPAPKEKLSYLTLSKAGCYLDFIGPVLARLKKIRVQLADTSVISGEESANSEAREELRQQFLSGRGEEFIPDEALLQSIRQHLDFAYAYEVDSSLPFKVSVSEIKLADCPEDEFELPQLYVPQEALPADDGEEAKEQQEEKRKEKQKEEFDETGVPEAKEASENDAEQETGEAAEDFFSYKGTLPEFLREKQETKGTDRGTLYHRVLELLPLTETPQRATIKEGLCQLIAAGKLKPEEVGALSVSKLLMFYESPVAERMRAAKRKNRLYQEQPFVFSLPASELLKKDSEEPILIQGIIDVFFEEDDGLVLLDYKTDYVPKEPEETLKRRYTRQLELYQRALEEITGKRVKEKLLYSFYLGKEIVVE